MIKVGLTGGIGSGKTTVSKLFKELGIPIFNSDLSGREAEHDPTVRAGFKRILGDDIFINDELDREKMRGIIFVDKDKLRQVNELVIPYIKKSFEEFCLRQKLKSYVILESAILFETGADKGFDYIITVTADIDTRMKRVLNRDKVSRELIQNKMNNQLLEIDRIAKSDFIIHNDGDDLLDSLESLQASVLTVHRSILAHELVKETRKHER